MQYFLKQMCLIVGIFQGAMVANTASATDMDRQWLAVGRLNVTGGGFCTATLIGEMHVLTAAHCVYDAQSGAPVDADDLEFRAGWQDGQAESYRKIAAVKVHPDFSFAEQEGLKRVASDLAILRLRTPITHPDITPFSVAQMPTAWRARCGGVLRSRSQSGTEGAPRLHHLRAQREGPSIWL